MKTLLIALLLGLWGLSAHAQKTIERNIEYGNRTITMDVKFASEIEVKTWDKPTIYFKADLTTEDGKYLDLYKLDIDEGGATISIVSDPVPIFKAFQKERDGNGSNSKNGYCCSNFEYTFNYTLYVPKNAVFKVSSINGNLKSDLVEGQFSAELINGNIDIKKYAGTLDLNTINGEIDLIMVNTRLKAETIHGNIFADERLKFASSKDKMIGQEIEGATDNAVHKLKLNTINGNMYLRKEL
tara:strand:+ start:23962 stop:24684 length:723 start_codon:yes stop_codon:yes gene_type:complete